MKKGVKPELSARWWTRNKAGTLGKTGLGAALKEYEVAEDLMDYARMLKALRGVEKSVKIATGKCNRSLHAETLQALKKYPSVIAMKKAQTMKKNAAEKEQAAPPKQKVGKKVVIWSRDVSKEIHKVCPAAAPSGFKANVELRLNDDILDILEKERGHDVAAFMVEDAQKACAATVASIVKTYKDCAKLVARDPRNVDDAMKKYEKAVTKELDELPKRLVRIPAARWAKFVARKKQYRKYQVITAFKLPINGLSVVGSGLGVIGGAVGVATGAGLPLGITGITLGVVGSLKSVSTLVQQACDLAVKAERVQKKLQTDLKALKKGYIDAAGKANRVGGKEALKTVGNYLLTGPFIRSVSTCKSDFDLWSNKVAGLAITGRKLSKAFIDLMHKLDKLEQALKKAPSKEAGELLDKVRKMRKSLTRAFDAAADMNGRVRKADDALPKIEAMLKELQGKNPNYAKIFDRVFPVVMNVGFAVVNFGVGMAGMSGALDGVNTSLGLANDILMEVEQEMEKHV